MRAHRGERRVRAEAHRDGTERSWRDCSPYDEDERLDDMIVASLDFEVARRTGAIKQRHLRRLRAREERAR